jgi:hypothetical protein
VHRVNVVVDAAGEVLEQLLYLHHHGGAAQVIDLVSGYKV